VATNYTPRCLQNEEFPHGHEGDTSRVEVLKEVASEHFLRPGSVRDIMASLEGCMHARHKDVCDELLSVLLTCVSFNPSFAILDVTIWSTFVGTRNAVNNC
jgi:hypothetical protein